eukprot:PLAT6092.1.p1 GENE.PLAT6092.1~~PLAT6092.1.p1  ORF type:complete len:274 (-),score=45.22 PLAT6092.1:59-838(-)
MAAVSGVPSYFGTPTDSKSESEMRKTRKRTTMTDLSSGFQVSSTVGLQALYCFHCGSFAALTSKALAALPVREVDGAAQLNKADLKQHTLVSDEDVYISRPGGYERQCRWVCPDCALPILYSPEPMDSTYRLLYVIAGALTTDPNIASVEEITVPDCFLTATHPSRCAFYVEAFASKRVTKLDDVDERRVALTVKSSSKEAELNASVIAFVASLLSMPSSQVRLEWGDRYNVVHVDGLSTEDAYLKLANALTASRDKRK